MMRAFPSRSLLFLIVAGLGLTGCIAAAPTGDEAWRAGGVTPMWGLATQEAIDARELMSGSSAGEGTSRGDVMTRTDWTPMALLVPSALTLHPPHNAPARLPTTGDFRYHGDLPDELTVLDFGSGNGHQRKSLAYEPFLQVYDLVMLPIRMFVGVPPHRLDASPDATYVRAPQDWSQDLPMTGRATGPIGTTVILRSTGRGRAGMATMDGGRS